MDKVPDVEPEEYDRIDSSLGVNRIRRRGRRPGFSPPSQRQSVLAFLLPVVLMVTGCAARPVTWNITRIAASGSPRAHELIHKVILASASVPGIFPPVVIDVEAGGETFQELHVDGGVTSQVFLYPTGLQWKKIIDKLEVPGRPNLYLIRNSQTFPVFKSTKRRILPLMTRSVSSLIRTQGIGDIATIYFETRRDGVAFHLAHVPDNFEAEPSEPFDQKYMQKLFKIGFEMAKEGYPWITGPTLPD